MSRVRRSRRIRGHSDSVGAHTRCPTDAVLTTLLEQFVKAGVRPKKTIFVVFIVNEEAGERPPPAASRRASTWHDRAARPAPCFPALSQAAMMTWAWTA